MAGEFVREELEDIRKGTHGARSAKQAIAIGLSKARRAGVPLAGKGKRTKKRPSASQIHGRPARRRARARRDDDGKARKSQRAGSVCGAAAQADNEV